MINKQKVFVKIKEFIIEIISEFFSNKKIIGMVILMIFVAVFKVSINGLAKEEVTETPKGKVSLDFLNSEEKELVSKFLKREINDFATKIKFSNLMKRKGDAIIQELKAAVIAATNRRNNPISQSDQIVLNKLINKMEKTKTEWSSQKLLEENESNDKKIK
jgi:hypothetical protein